MRRAVRIVEVAALCLLVSLASVALIAPLAAAANLVPNGSLEESSGDPPMPDYWQHTSWGDNTPAFEYLEEGHAGSRSVKVTLSDYVSGDARWQFDPQPLSREQMYTFSVYYRTNTQPQVSLQLTHDDDSPSYPELPIPFPDGTTDWQHYQETFFVPADVKAVTVYMRIARNGWLQTDDYFIDAYTPVGFDDPIVTLTFDDGLEDNVDTVLPRLATLGFKATQFNATKFIEGNPAMEEKLLAFRDAGHEIGSHSVNHDDLTTLTPEQLDYELSHSRQYLQALTGKPICNFAAPFGFYDEAVFNAVREYYRSNRTVDSGYNSRDNLAPYRLRVQNLAVGTSLAEYQSWLNAAAADNTWLVLVYHRVTNDTPGDYDTLVDDFDDQMQALADSGIEVKTLDEALNELTIPIIEEVSPSSGLYGAEVTIGGDNFGCMRGSSKVLFNGRAVSEYISWSNAEIVVRLPRGATSGPVRVQTRGGTSNGVQFTVYSDSSTWYLAEGTTAWGFSTYITIQNPNDTALAAHVTYMPKGSANVTEDVPLPALSQTTITNDALLSSMGGAKDFSTKVVSSDLTKPIAVDRTMEWTGAGAASPEAHSSAGADSASDTWYLPEGSTNWGFETWLSVQNPNGTRATCTLTYMVKGEDPVTKTKTVPANSRESFSMQEDIGSKDASIRVTSDKPVVAERQVYGDSRREGHGSIGATTPALSYYLAEGTTDYGFTTYLCIQNPNDSEVEVTVTYMTRGSAKPQTPFTMKPNTRETIRVNDVPGMAGTDFSTKVTGTKPIIAERPMYWNSETGEACHDSIGMSASRKTFYLPDGQTSDGRETYTCVQNPNGTAVTVEITYMTPDGKGNVTKTETIGANSRQTYPMAEHSGIQGRAAVMVTSRTAGKNIVVERVMYWNDRGAGTDTVGGYGD